MEQEALSLAELNNYILDILEANFPDELWVTAEISELRVNRKGHCYIDFIERDELTKKIVARQRATVWAFQYNLIKTHFEHITGQALSDGMRVLVKVKVNFHVLYGLSLNVVDLDPAYTLGEQARYREEIIKKLEQEGVIDMNRELSLAAVPQRLAVISSETAAGFGDFVNQLENNQHQYKFEYTLYSASMQGDDTSRSVVSALEAIYEEENRFDAVLIIRGGGAKAELTAFDDYDIAFMIAQSPLPVLTGIGHERDESVADIVAWRSFKTPTAVAGFLIDHLSAFEARIDEMTAKLQLLTRYEMEQAKSQLQRFQSNIQALSSAYIRNQKHYLENALQGVKHAFDRYIRQQQVTLDDYKSQAKNAVLWSTNRSMMQLETMQTRLKHATSQFIAKKHHELAIYQEKATLNSPEKLLKGGYGYVTANGKRIKAANQLAAGEQIRIAFSDGDVDARVLQIKLSNQQQFQK